MNRYEQITDLYSMMNFTLVLYKILNLPNEDVLKKFGTEWDYALENIGR